MSASPPARSVPPRLDLLALWILFGCWCCMAGWTLSLFGALDRVGYAVAFLLFLAGLFFARRHLVIPDASPSFVPRLRRPRRLLPGMWLVLVVLFFLGGAFYHPDNYDYLTYRFPRVLHWCWDRHWSWIDTPIVRENLSATGMEWMLTPVFVLLHSDRFFFLLNFVSYLFLPGLVFTVFCGLGVAGRVCWWWMWTLPAGLCYALQAGGLGNDMFAAVYFLAALYYLQQLGRTRAPRDLVLSCLALALLTGTKALNVPLVLPWLALAFCQRGAVGAACRPGGLALIAVGGILASFLPTALLNIHYTGSYTGDPHNLTRMQVTDPIAGILGNGIITLAGNLWPPIWLHGCYWTLPFGLQDYIVRGFPRFQLRNGPFTLEEGAGLGLGVSLFVALSLVYGLRASVATGIARRPRGPHALALAAATLAAWLVYAIKLGGEGAERLLAVYYIAALGALLTALPFDGIATRRRWWRGLAFLALLIVFPVLILYPSRPLIPLAMAEPLLRAIGAPASALTQLRDNGRMRAARFDNLQQLRLQIPPGERAIGSVAGSDDPQVTLWLPFGSRQVIDLDPHAPASLLRDRQVRYVVVSETALHEANGPSVADLQQAWSMRVVARQNVSFKTDRQAQPWVLLGPPAVPAP